MDRFKRIPVREQEPKVRATNFEEVCLGYNEEEAVAEASRCLNCPKPRCVGGCPVGINIPGFIAKVKERDFEGAAKEIAKYSALPAVCGRVCPQENQCEGQCVLGVKGEAVAIGKLERFVADWAREHKVDLSQKDAPKGKKVAIIGAGPAGLTCAGDLAKKGYEVKIFEALHKAGGVLEYGIPEFRLPKEVVRRETKRISELGVSFICNSIVGRDITIDQMFESGFDAVFIGTGTAISKELNIPGKELTGVIQSHYFLRMVALYNSKSLERKEVPVDEGDTVLVIGAGNVAMDAARTALRMGAKSVTVVYRRGQENMSAEKAEYESAVADNVKFMWETSPVEYVGRDGRLEGLKLMNNDNEFIIPADKVLVAIGSKPAKRIISTTKGIEVNDNGYLITKEKPYGMTTLNGVFAGGDVVHQPATVVLAMKEAKKVVAGIASYVDAVKLLGYKREDIQN